MLKVPVVVARGAAAGDCEDLLETPVPPRQSLNLILEVEVQIAQLVPRERWGTLPLVPG